MADRIGRAIALNPTVARHIGAISSQIELGEGISWDDVANYIAQEEGCTPDEAFEMMEQAQRDGMFSEGRAQ